MDDSPPSAIPLTSSKLSRKNRKNNNAVKQSHRKTINVNYSSEHVLQIRAQNPSHTPPGHVLRSLHVLSHTEETASIRLRGPTFSINRG